MIDLEIVPFDATKASETDWQKYHTFRKIRHEETQPNVPMVSDKSLEETLKILPTRLEIKRFNVFEKKDLNTQIADIYFSYYKEADSSSDKNTAMVNLAVLNSHRHQGVGVQLFKKITDLAKEYKKSRVIFQSMEDDGMKVLEQHVHAVKISEQEQFRLNVHEINQGILSKWLSETKTVLDKVTFEWIQVVDLIPSEILEQYSRIMASAVDEEKKFHIGAGKGTSKVVPLESLKEDIRLFNSKGGKWVLGMIREKNGDVSGLTELKWSPSRPEVILQFVTHIKLKYRGTGKGKLLKALSINYLKENFPNVKYVQTGFVGSKDSALYKINEKLGFKLFFHSASYEVKTTDLEKWVKEHFSKN